MWQTLKIVCGVVVALIAAWLVLVFWPVNDGHTPAQRRAIAEACLAMLHSSLTNEMDDIEVNDPRVPQVIRDLHPYSISISSGFDVDIYSNGKPPEYFLMHMESQHAWILCAAGPVVAKEQRIALLYPVKR
jgi:di/tricarboxylate transporter